jgi:inner membrane protein
MLAVAGGEAGGSHDLLAAARVAVWALVMGAGTVGSHILADALTPTGVRPFAPYRDGFYSYNMVGVFAASGALAMAATCGLTAGFGRTSHQHESGIAGEMDINALG